MAQKENKVHLVIRVLLDLVDPQDLLDRWDLLAPEVKEEEKVHLVLLV